MVLIYVQKITPRVLYTFKQVCRRILGLEIDFTSKIESFIAHNGAKFSYGKQPLGKELYFQGTELLFEYGFNELDIQVYPWEDTKCFFMTKHPDAALPFDIFAATFYLLTRYEEYLPHVKDTLGRFTAKQSIAYIHGFLEDPVVDIWAHKFKAILQEKYPTIAFVEKTFSCLPVVNVSQTFTYGQKGILRSIGGGLRDLWKLRFSDVSDRISVLLNLKKDPYNTFDYLITLMQAHRRKCVVFFGLGDYATHEKNINHSNLAHKRILKHVADYMDVGLKVSYDAIADVVTLKREKKRIESTVHRQLRYATCAFNKIKLPEAYRNFIELEIQEDFSMGYDDHTGFRAGTCTPFLFYDLDYEVQTPLLIHSFCCTATAFNSIRNATEVATTMQLLIDKIRRVEGVFIPVYTNGILSDKNPTTYWKSILKSNWKL